MATNTTDTTFYNGNSAISWRSLQQNFEPSGASDPVRFSEFYRNTDIDTNHIDLVVPDATENSSINTSGRLEAGHFRGAIKEYVVVQSGTETQYQINSAPTWNSNLDKNVFKRMKITGTCRAGNTAQMGAIFNTLAYNLRIQVDGGTIEGEGGAGGTGSDCTQRNGSSGGIALYIRNTSTRTTGASSRTEVETLNSGTIRGGGGGGASGAQGSGGGSQACSVTSDYTYTVWSSHSYNGNRACNQSACDSNRTINYAADSNRGHTGNHSYTGSLNNSGNAYNAGNCWGQRGSRGRCRGRWDRGQPCHPVWNKKCMYTANFNINAAAGCGGNGGKGQGPNSAAGGNGGAAGQRAHCNTSGSFIVGNSGNSGASGGNWGAVGGNSGNANGGAAGHAIQSGDGRTSDVISGNSEIYGPMNGCSVGANP